MKNVLRPFLMIACFVPLMFSCSDTKNTVRTIPLEDFFRNPEKSSFRISPSGEYYSYLAPFEDRMNIHVQKAGSDEVVRITTETARDIAGYFWANDNRILYLKDTGGDENFQLFGVNIDGTDLKAYTAIPGVRTEIIDNLEDQEKYIIIGTNERNPEVFDPYRLNLETGQRTMLAENPGNIKGWDTDNDGKLRVAYAMDGVNSQIYYRENEDDEFRLVLETSFKESVQFVRFTPDNRNVWAVSNIGRDKAALVLMDPATCTETEQLYMNDKYDLDGAWYSKKQQKLLAAQYTGHKETVMHYFDDGFKGQYETLRSKLQDYDIAVTSRNKEEDVWIVYAGSDRVRGNYYIYRVDEEELVEIADMTPWLKAEELAQMYPVTYPARDGVEIEAYLTLPVGYTLKNAKGLPVVINPHGGPWARDYWGYNSEVQFLANRGYAVLQMNFRGSTGFGKKFLELSYKEWGQTMQDDITDGTLWLIDEGIADPERIAIYGGSYGGYATLMGIVKTPDLYAAAVDYVGVSNLFTFMNTIPPYWRPLLDMMYEMVGDPVADSLMLAQNSPSLNAEKIKTPLFIVQGANDPRVNKDESDQMVEALKKQGVEVEYMVKYDEGHGFRLQENKFEFYSAMEKFLDQHLKPGLPENPDAGVVQP